MSKGKKLLLAMVLMGMSICAALALVEIGLWVMGRPTEIPMRIAHPPNMVDKREYIEFTYTVKANADGIRARSFPVNKPPGKFRVVAVGDSFTEGIGVEVEDRFTNVLERIANQRLGEERVEIMTGGLGGTGTLSHARVLTHIGLRYKPDLVLICVFANDPSDADQSVTLADIDRQRTQRSGLRALLHLLLPRTKTMISQAIVTARYRHATKTNDIEGRMLTEAKRRNVSDERVARWRKHVPPELVEAVNNGRLGGATVSMPLLRPTMWSDALDVDTEPAKARMAAMQRILTEMVRRSRDAGAKVALVYQPCRYTYDQRAVRPDHWWRLAGMKVNESWATGQTRAVIMLKQWAAEQKVAFFDLTEPMRAAVKTAKEPLDFKEDGHWTVVGNAAAATATADWFLGLVPPN